MVRLLVGIFTAISFNLSAQNLPNYNWAPETKDKAKDHTVNPSSPTTTYDVKGATNTGSSNQTQTENPKLQIDMQNVKPFNTESALNQPSCNVVQDQITSQTTGYKTRMQYQNDFNNACNNELIAAKKDPNNYFIYAVGELTASCYMTPWRRSVLTQSLSMLLDNKTKLLAESVVYPRALSLTLAIKRNLEDTKKVVKAEKINGAEAFFTDLFFSAAPAQQYDRDAERKEIGYVHILEKVGVAYGEKALGQQSIDAIKEVAFIDPLSPLFDITVSSLKTINGDLSQRALSDLVFSVCEECKTKGDPVVPDLDASKNLRAYEAKMSEIVIFLAKQKRTDLVASIYSQAGSANLSFGAYSSRYSKAVKNTAAQSLGRALPYPNEKIYSCINNVVDHVAYITFTTAVPGKIAIAQPVNTVNETKVVPMYAECKATGTSGPEVVGGGEPNPLTLVKNESPTTIEASNVPTSIIKAEPRGKVVDMPNINRQDNIIQMPQQQQLKKAVGSDLVPTQQTNSRITDINNNPISRMEPRTTAKDVEINSPKNSLDLEKLNIQKGTPAETPKKSFFSKLFGGSNKTTTPTETITLKDGSVVENVTYKSGNNKLTAQGKVNGKNTELGYIDYEYNPGTGTFHIDMVEVQMPYRGTKLSTSLMEKAFGKIGKIPKYITGQATRSNSTTFLKNYGVERNAMNIKNGKPPIISESNITEMEQKIALGREQEASKIGKTSLYEDIRSFTQRVGTDVIDRPLINRLTGTDKEIAEAIFRAKENTPAYKSLSKYGYQIESVDLFQLDFIDVKYVLP